MAVFYLKHPVHGSKVAISDSEVKYDESLGWVLYNPEAERLVAPKQPEESKVNALIEPVAVPDFLAPQPEKPKGKGGRPRTAK